MTICDIGHNEHGLRHNFAQLARMKDRGADLIIVYGSVADKDVDSVMHLMPGDATYIFTQAQSKRALAAIRASGVVADDEASSAKQVLSAAAMTYVAALALSLAQFIHLLSRVSRSRR